MFNIFSHQGNSNSNSNEIPPRRIDYYQESIQWHTNAAKGTGNKEQKLVHSPWKSMWKLLKQIKTRADGMAQLLEALAAKSDNLSSIPGTQMAGDNQVPPVVIRPYTGVNNYVCLLHDCLKV